MKDVSNMHFPASAKINFNLLPCGEAGVMIGTSAKAQKTSELLCSANNRSENVA
jgi:hypothetical protein